MVHFISPFRVDKNIGLALNEAIKQLNADPNDWICHIDMDVLWLRPDSKKQLVEILETTDYDVLGTATNRLAMQHQLVLTFEGENVFNNTDIKFHYRIANKLHEDNYGKVFQIADILAAFCLCFRVSTWQKLGGFHENSLQFDSLFSAHARRMQLKLGIMIGIYCFHSYRLMSDNPTQDIMHLLQ